MERIFISDEKWMITKQYKLISIVSLDQSSSQQRHVCPIYCLPFHFINVPIWSIHQTFVHDCYGTGALFVVTIWVELKVHSTPSSDPIFETKSCVANMIASSLKAWMCELLSSSEVHCDIYSSFFWMNECDACRQALSIDHCFCIFWLNWFRPWYTYENRENQ